MRHPSTGVQLAHLYQSTFHVRSCRAARRLRARWASAGRSSCRPNSRAPSMARSLRRPPRSASMRRRARSSQSSRTRSPSCERTTRIATSALDTRHRALPPRGQCRGPHGTLSWRSATPQKTSKIPLCVLVRRSTRSGPLSHPFWPAVPPVLVMLPPCDPLPLLSYRPDMYYRNASDDVLQGTLVVPVDLLNNDRYRFLIFSGHAHNRHRSALPNPA